ncbi:hypothetical protein ABIE89_000292 [Bradyrhizobium niftali]
MTTMAPPGLYYLVHIHECDPKPLELFRGRQECSVSDIDQMGIVVDWVDACRKGDLAMLLDLYADDAQVECTWNGTQPYHRGRRELESYRGAA